MSSTCRDDLQSFFAELHRRQAVRQRPAKERRRQKQQAARAAAPATAAPGGALASMPSTLVADAAPGADTALTAVPSTMVSEAAPASEPSDAAPVAEAAPRPLAILVAGGVGGMITDYREIVESFGYRFLYRDARALRVMPPALAACLVLVTTISQPLSINIATLAKKRGIPVVYLRKHSLKAVREAMKVLAALEEETP